MKDLIMVQFVELIHLMYNLYKMIQDGDFDNSFYLMYHFYCHHYLCCSFEFQSVIGLIMIQLVQLIFLIDDLYRMIQGDVYNEMVSFLWYVPTLSSRNCKCLIFLYIVFLIIPRVPCME